MTIESGSGAPVAGEPAPVPQAPSETPPPPIAVATIDSEERSLAALAHGSMVLNLFVPGLGIIAAAAVWLMQSDRSSYVARQAQQATLYQILLAVATLALGVGGTIVALILLFTGVFVGIGALIGGTVLLVLAILAVLAILGIGFLYGLVGAYEAFQGRNFRYWLVGDMVK